MNLIRLLPPAVALVLVGTWLGVQQLSISAMESENGLLRKAIAAARLVAPANDFAHGKTALADKAPADTNPLDWEKLAGQFVELQKSGGTGDPRPMLRFQQRLQAMNRDQILAALDEIAALNLPAASRSLLEQPLITALMEQDPESVLTRFTDRLGGRDEAMDRQLAAALNAWAKLDPRKAADWFDRQIAAGKFDSTSLDGRSPARMRFEGALLGVLLTSDPASAAGRLAALPEDQRGEAIGNAALSPPGGKALATFARLVRTQVPANDQAAAFARQAGQWVAQGGYASVTAYLGGIRLTADERIGCIEQAAATRIFSNNKRIAAADLDALREWVGSQAPQLTDSITGKVLCTAALGNLKLDFAQAAELAIQYSQASGNDNVLIALVENWAARSNKDEARALAERITDVKRRAEILKRLE